MALFDRRRKQDNAINEEPDLMVGSVLPFGMFGGTYGKYSNGYLWMVLKNITDALHNVRFYKEGAYDGYYSTKDGKQLKKYINFIDRNANKLWWQSLNLGFMAVGQDAKGELYVVEAEDIRYKPDGVSVDEVSSGVKYLLYSDRYQLTGKSDLQMIKENIRTIDIFKDGDLNLTASGGALGILSGKGMAMNQRDKLAFEHELKNTFGIEGRKRQILISNAELDFKQMKLDVKDLQLIEKIREEIKFLCGFFNIPYDLVPFSGQSTYANQEQAIVNLYRNCISPIAEQLLMILRSIVVKNRAMGVYSETITFTFDNVPELENDKSAEVDFDLKVMDLIERARALQLDSTKYEKLLKQ